VNSAPWAATTQRRRKLLWLAFWFVSFITIAVLISMPMLIQAFPLLVAPNDYGLTVTGVNLLGGSCLAALILARLHSKTIKGFVLQTLGWTCLLMVVFGLISRVGCGLTYFNR
jgi:hypothetical protein